MRIVIENGTNELLETLKNNGYDVKVVEELEKEVVEVEKLVEVEKELPVYLKTINDVILDVVKEGKEEAQKQLDLYKGKLDKIVSLFNEEEAKEEVQE